MVWKPLLLGQILICYSIHGSLANTVPFEEKDDIALGGMIAPDSSEIRVSDTTETLSAIMKEEELDNIEDEVLDTVEGAELDTAEKESNIYLEDPLDTYEKEQLYTPQSQADSRSSCRSDSEETKSSKAMLVSDARVLMTKAPDCKSLYEAGMRENGIYQLYIEDPGSQRPLTPQVYCELSDSSIDGGGWTYIQSRVDDSVDFYRYWDEYEDGFGDPAGNYWVGLKVIHELTSPKDTVELMVNLEPFTGSIRYAHYKDFFVGDSSGNYKISIGRFSGTAGDSLARHNNMMFSTRGRDNALSKNNPCAELADRKGGWWFENCSNCQLNGVYYDETYTGQNHGIHWMTYRNDWNSPRFQRVSMKIRRK